MIVRRFSTRTNFSVPHQLVKSSANSCQSLVFSPLLLSLYCSYRYHQATCSLDSFVGPRFNRGFNWGLNRGFNQGFNRGFNRLLVIHCLEEEEWLWLLAVEVVDQLGGVKSN